MINITSYAKPKETSGGGGGTVSTFRPSGSGGVGTLSMVTIWGNEFDGSQDVEGDLTINNHKLTINNGNAEMLSGMWTDSYFKFLQSVAAPSVTTTEDADGNTVDVVDNGHYSRLLAQNTVFSLHSTNDPIYAIENDKFVISYPVDDKNVMAGIFFGEDYYGIQEDNNVTRIRKYDINTGVGKITQLETDYIHKKSNDTAPIGVYSPMSFKEKIFTTNIQNSGEIVTKDLTVTGAAHFFELVIDKLRSVGGQVILTAANAKVDYVEYFDTYYRLYSKATDEDGNAVDQMFVEGDQIKCQSFNRKQLVPGQVNYNVSNQYWWRLCTAAGTIETDKFDGVTTMYNYVDVSDEDKDMSSLEPKAGDEIVLLGSRNADANRSHAIILSAYKSVDMSVEAPSIVQYKNITTYELEPYKYQVIASNGNYFRGDFKIEASGLSLDDHLREWMNGKISYTHIAYANDIDGTGFTKVNNNQYYDYIGFCVNNNESDEDLVFTDYEWSRLRGEDAEMLYTWIRYADDAAGTNFSDNPVTGDRLRYYIGFAYNKTTPTESEDWREYSWVKIDAKDGADGKDGAFTWIKYADSIDETTGYPTEMYDTPTTKTEYIGIATGQEGKVETTNIYVYKWSKFKGDQGVPGADGASLYTWVKYSNSSNGYNMSDSPWINGKRAEYIGFAYNKKSQQESSDYTQYTWFLWKGTDGTDGIDGVSGYIWVKYADEVGPYGVPSVMYDIPTEATQYMGIATGQDEKQESSYPGDYVWSKIKGDQGIPGEALKIEAGYPKYFYNVFDTNTTRPEAVTDWPYTEIPSEKLVQNDWLYTKIETKYNDGTVTNSYGVTLIGADGAQGDSAFVHFAYASDVTFDANNVATAVSGFALTWFDGAAYIGTLSDTRKEDPTDWSEYKWARLKGDPGASTFTSYMFARFSSTPSNYQILKSEGSYSDPSPSNSYGWSDTVPSGTAQVWMQSRIFTSDGKAPQQATWTTPTKMLDTADMDICFSSSVSQPDEPTSHGNQGDISYRVWHDTATEADIWMAISYRIGGEWGPWQIVKIKGEDGVGVYITSTSIKYALTQYASKPYESSTDWKTSIPTLKKGYYLWTWTHVEYSDGNKTDTYGCSYIATDGVDGTDGKDGIDGTDGKDGVETTMYKLIPLAETAEIDHETRNLGVHFRYQYAKISGTTTTIHKPLNYKNTTDAYIIAHPIKNGVEQSGTILGTYGTNNDVYWTNAKVQTKWDTTAAASRITGYMIYLYVKGSMVEKKYVPVTLEKDATFVIDKELNEIRTTVTDTKAELDGDISLLETKIKQNAESITSEAKRIDVANGKINEHSTLISQNADEIALVAKENDEAVAGVKLDIDNIKLFNKNVSILLNDNIVLDGDTIVDGNLSITDGNGFTLVGNTGSTSIIADSIGEYGDWANKSRYSKRFTFTMSSGTPHNAGSVSNLTTPITLSSDEILIDYIPSATSIDFSTLECWCITVKNGEQIGVRPTGTISASMKIYRNGSLQRTVSGSTTTNYTSFTISDMTDYTTSYSGKYSVILSLTFNNFATALPYLKCSGNFIVKYTPGYQTMLGYDGLGACFGTDKTFYAGPNATMINYTESGTGGKVFVDADGVSISGNRLSASIYGVPNTTSITLTANDIKMYDMFVSNCSSGDVTVTLPAPSLALAFREFKFKNICGRSVTYKCSSKCIWNGDDTSPVNSVTAKEMIYCICLSGGFNGPYYWSMGRYY